MDHVHNVELLLMCRDALLLNEYLGGEEKVMVLEQHNLYLAHEDCEDDDLHDDGFYEDSALVEVLVWHVDHDDVDQDDDVGHDDDVDDAGDR